MPGQRRIASLDGLRAVSIVCVLSWHLNGTAGFPIHYALDGPLGVRVFFVLSGYLITWLMIEEEHRSGSVSLASFYRRRAVRILPVLWCYLAVVAVLGWIGVLHVDWIADLVAPLSFTNVLLFRSHHSCWQTGHLWSLTIEEHFYLLWPAAFLLLGAARRRLLALMALLALGPAVRAWIFVHPTRSWIMPSIVGNFDMLAWGCFLAVLQDCYGAQVQRAARWRPAMARLVCVIAILFAPWYFWRAFNRVCPPLSMLALSMSVQAAAIAFLIASLTLVQRGWSFRLLNLRPVARVGIWSYSIYLWQQLFLHPTPLPRRWETWPMNLACALVVAIGSYYLIERPLFRLRGRRESVAEPVGQGAALAW